MFDVQAGGSSQQGSHHGSDLALAEVAEYLASDANKLPSMGSLGSTSAEPQVFRPGWEDIFRMNQKQLEVRTCVESTNLKAHPCGAPELLRALALQGCTACP